jgi:outer membrane protein TolC
MRRGKLLVVFLIFCLAPIVYSQKAPRLLGFDGFMEQVIASHPLSNQANLRLSTQRLVQMQARGAMDPKLSSSFSEKQFGGNQYYQYFNSSIKIPTSLGISVVGGYEQTGGIYLNPESLTDDLGLWYTGIELDVLRGFRINERSVGLRKADIQSNLLGFEAEQLRNQLQWQAGNAYLNWQEYFWIDAILRNGQELAEQYHQNTKLAFLNGEKTALDTLEAFILAQDALAAVQANSVSLEKYVRALNTFIWSDTSGNLGYYPDTLNDSILLPFENIGIASNPALQLSRGKIELIEQDQRLYKEALKPALKLKYNPLLATSDESIMPVFAPSNYKWGVDLAFPVFWRKERAKIQMNQIKLKENKYALDLKQVQLENKLSASMTNIGTLQEQLEVVMANVDRYQRLLEGETIRFDLGESSVFLLNKRQEKYMESRIKQIKTIVALRRERLYLNYLTNNF